MIRSKVFIISLVFILLDALIVWLSFLIASFIRSILSTHLGLSPFVSWDDILILAELGTFFIFALFLFQGLYPGYGLTTVKEFEKICKLTTLVFILITTFSYLIKSFQTFPRSIVALTWLICMVFLPTIRFVARNLLSRVNIYGLPVIVFGDGELAKEIIHSLESVRRFGWRPNSQIPINEVPLLKPNHSLMIAIMAYEFDISLIDKIQTISQQFRRVVVINEFNNGGSLWVETRDIDGYLGLEYHYKLLSKTSNLVKRLTDIIGSMVLLLLLIPVLVVVSILIKLDSNGPILYRQERLGRNFKRIYVYKFRSMVVGAEEKLKQLLENDPNAKEKFENFHKLEQDPRVTKIGRILRRFSIDEFPQLWNVMKGDMSLCGPRAYLPSELENMGIHATTILRVNPGMTGWWQVLGRHNTTFQERLQMDKYYISNWSLWMDTYIFLKTVIVVIRGKGV